MGPGNFRECLGEPLGGRSERAPAQRDVLKVRAGEVGSPQVGAVEHGPPKVCAPEVGVAKVSTREVGRSQVCSLKVHAAQHRPGEFPATEIRSGTLLTI